MSAERTSESNLPLFPLRTVLFPEGFLPLRIFEARYVDMVAECMRRSQPFGVVLRMDESGTETHEGDFLQLAAMGTLAQIDDFNQLEDGLLGIQCRGLDRFHLRRAWQDETGLHRGEVELMDAMDSQPLPPEFAILGRVLEELLEQIEDWYPEPEPAELQDAEYVSARLSEFLPMPLERRQQLLELNDANDRLEQLLLVMSELQQDDQLQA